MNRGILVGVIAAVMFGGGGFYAGQHYAQSQSPTARSGQGANFAGRGGTNGVARGGGVFGTIISKDSSSITVQLVGGPGATSSGQTSTGSRIVFFDNSTQIGKFTSGTTADLTAGENVTVAGTANSDGSITAQSIQIRPAGVGGARGQ